MPDTLDEYRRPILGKISGLCLATKEGASEWVPWIREQ